MEQQQQAPHMDTVALEAQNSVAQALAMYRTEIVQRGAHIQKLEQRIVDLEKALADSAAKTKATIAEVGARGEAAAVCFGAGRMDQNGNLDDDQLDNSDQEA